jgi:hypothetical protein
MFVLAKIQQFVLRISVKSTSFSELCYQKRKFEICLKGNAESKTTYHQENEYPVVGQT